MRVRISNTDKFQPVFYSEPEVKNTEVRSTVDVAYSVLTLKTNMIRIIVNESRITDGDDNTEILGALDAIPESLYYHMIIYNDSVRTAVPTNIYYRLRMYYSKYDLVSLGTLIEKTSEQCDLIGNNV